MARSGSEIIFWYVLALQCFTCDVMTRGWLRLVASVYDLRAWWLQTVIVRVGPPTLEELEMIPHGGAGLLTSETSDYEL